MTCGDDGGVRKDGRPCRANTNPPSMTRCRPHPRNATPEELASIASEMGREGLAVQRASHRGRHQHQPPALRNRDARGAHPGAGGTEVRRTIQHSRCLMNGVHTPSSQWARGASYGPVKRATRGAPLRGRALMPTGKGRPVQRATAGRRMSPNEPCQASRQAGHGRGGEGWRQS